MSVGNAPGVSVKRGASVGGTCVEVEIDVSVGIAEGVEEIEDGGEQEVRREKKRKDERMRDAT